MYNLLTFDSFVCLAGVNPVYKVVNDVTAPPVRVSITALRMSRRCDSAHGHSINVDRKEKPGLF